MKQQRLKEETKENICKVYVAREIKVQTVANMFNTTASTVRKILKQNNIKLRRRGTSNIKRQEIVNKYIEGKSTIELAKEYQLDVVSICNYLKEFNVKVRDKIDVHRVYNRNSNYFTDIDTEEKAYWLGFIYADGCIYRPKKGSKVLTIQLAIKDKNHLEKLAKALNYTGPIRCITSFTKGKYREYAILNIADNKLCNDLFKWGVQERKTFTTKFPYNIPKQMYKHFIRGYWDGDGSLHKGNSYTLSCAGTKEFLSSIDEVICNALNLNRVKIYTKNAIDKLSRSGKYKSSKIAQWLYSNATIYLERKYEIFENKYNFY